SAGKDYSLIIPAYNEEKLLPATLDSVRKAMESVKRFSGEGIVVDNHSTDQTATIAREKGFQVVWEPIQQISRSRNRGAEMATGKILIFLDADTHLSPELLQATLEGMTSNQYYGGGTTITFDAPLPWLAKNLTRLWNRLSQWQNWSAGCYLFALREAFEAAGGFPKEVYCAEEILLSHALKKWGKKHRKKYLFLRDVSICTSARKVKEFSTSRLFLLLVMVTFCPFLITQKWFCRKIWYTRSES
ncbi:MAG: glycosyltransferase, partial [Planctomycetia bacterium]|nr:glycosyltransferase [Planctomycetia bacterium]